MYIHKSTLISHFNKKQANIKSRAPFSIFSKLCKSRAPVPKRLPEHTETETFPIPRVIYIRMSKKEAIEDTVDDLHSENEDNIEKEESEVTVLEIDNFRNECMRERDEDINRKLLRNHEVVKRDILGKRRVLCGPFPSHFEKLLAMMELSGIIARCAIVFSRSHCRKL